MDNKAVANVKKQTTVAELAHNEKFNSHVGEILKEKAPQFITSVLSLTNSSPALAKCDGNAVFKECMKAAALDLPVDPNLGLAYVIPYGNSPMLQIGYKGFIQLAMRSGKYENIGAREVYKNELQGFDEFTGERVIKFLPEDERGDEVVGYMAFFVTTDGFKKRLYMSNKELEAHGRKYSKSYNRADGIWKTQPEAMRMKTVIKLLLSRWGILSTQMAQAIKDDQTSDDEYIDRKPDIEITNAEMGDSEEDRKSTLSDEDNERLMKSIMN